MPASPDESILRSHWASCHGNRHRGSRVIRRRELQSNKKKKQRAPGRGRTDQRGSAGAPAERLVEGRAAELQLLQVTVGDPDVGGQGQTLVQVLEHTDREQTRGDDLMKL